MRRDSAITSAGARKFGAAGDFVTAPELTPLFGAALATAAADVIDRLPDGDLIELGPGTGRLAADLLNALVAKDRLPRRYRLLEVSADLAARQRECLRERAPALLPRVDWIEILPARWRGADDRQRSARRRAAAPDRAAARCVVRARRES